MQVCGKKSSLCVNQSCALFYNQQRLAATSTQSWRNFQQQQQPERTASPDGAPKPQCLWNAYEMQMSWSVSRIRCDGVEECTWMLQRDDSQICCWFFDEKQREREREARLLQRVWPHLRRATHNRDKVWPLAVIKWSLKGHVSWAQEREISRM